MVESAIRLGKVSIWVKIKFQLDHIWLKVRKTGFAEPINGFERNKNLSDQAKLRELNSSRDCNLNSLNSRHVWHIGQCLLRWLLLFGFGKKFR